MHSLGYEEGFATISERLKVSMPTSVRTWTKTEDQATKQRRSHSEEDIAKEKRKKHRQKEMRAQQKSNVAAKASSMNYGNGIRANVA